MHAEPRSAAMAEQSPAQGFSPSVQVTPRVPPMVQHQQHRQPGVDMMELMRMTAERDDKKDAIMETKMEARLAEMKADIKIPLYRGGDMGSRRINTLRSGSECRRCH